MVTTRVLSLLLLAGLLLLARGQECSSGGQCKFVNCAALGRAPCHVDCGEETRFCFGQCKEGGRKGICFGLSRCKRVCHTRSEAGKLVTRCRCEAPPPKCTCHVFDYRSLVDPAASKMKPVKGPARPRARKPGTVRTPEPDPLADSVSMMDGENETPIALPPGA